MPEDWDTVNRYESHTIAKINAKTPTVRQVTSYADPKLSEDFEEFNKAIGYPTNKNTKEEQTLAPYQIDYHKAIEEHHSVIVNKSRKIGITEAGIRSIAYNCFNRYKGHDVMIVAGNELGTAREILLRFFELFANKPKWGYALRDKNDKEWYQHEIIRRSAIYSAHPTIEFHNGTRVMCYAASKSGKSQSFRGADDVACIFFSEAAHTGMLEDQPIMNALEPNLANRETGDIILESTPNGRRGFFFNYWMDLMEKKMGGWEMKEWDYRHGLKAGILAKEYLEKQKKNIRVDFAQEYMCKFTSTVTGILREEDIVLLSESEKKSIDYMAEIGLKDETAQRNDFLPQTY